MSVGVEIVLATLLFAVFAALAAWTTLEVARTRGQWRKQPVLDEQGCRKLIAPISAVHRCADPHFAWPEHKLTRPARIPSAGAGQVEGAAAHPNHSGGNQRGRNDAHYRRPPQSTRGPRPTLTTPSPRAPRNAKT